MPKKRKPTAHQIVFGPGVQRVIDKDPLGFDACMDHHIARMNRDSSDAPWKDTPLASFSSFYQFHGHPLTIATDLVKNLTRVSLDKPKRSR